MQEQVGSVQRCGAAALPALLLAALLLVPSLFARGLLPPDEARYADVALAMRESGEGLVPRLHQQWYSEKPPVFFWAVAALDRLGVPVAMGPRLVSILSALAILALLPVVARGFGVAQGSARRGTLVLATLPLFAIYAQLGFIDQLLALEVTAAAACALERGRIAVARRAARTGWALAEGLLLALALLTKGPVALLFAAGLRAGAALARPSDGARVPGRAGALDLLVLGVAGAVAGAWLLAASRVAGADYVWKLTLGQLERRILGSEPKHHVRPGFLAAVVLAGSLPWSVLALGARVPWSWRAAVRLPPRLAGLVGWGVLPVACLAAIPTQQPHYALPSLPPLALLAAELLSAPIRRGARRAAAAIAVALSAALVAATLWIEHVPGISAFDPEVVRRLAHDHVLAGVVALAALTAILAATWRTGQRPPDAPARAVLGVVAWLAALPVIAWRADELMNASSLVTSPALASAPRIVAPTGLRSAVRLATRLPLVEESRGRALEELVDSDPALVVIAPRSTLEASGLLPRVRVVARGFMRGREMVAVRGPLGSVAAPAGDGR